MKIDRTSSSARSTGPSTDPTSATGASKRDLPPPVATPRDPGKMQAARERFAATNAGPSMVTSTKPSTQVTRAFVKEQAAEGALTGKEATKALEMGASVLQVVRWSAGETISAKAAKVLVEHDLAPPPGADPAAPFSAGGRDYASAKDYVRYQAAEGVLTANEVRVALKRGASPEQIETWASGESISEDGRGVLALARLVDVTEPSKMPSPLLAAPPPVSRTPALPAPALPTPALPPPSSTTPAPPVRPPRPPTVTPSPSVPPPASTTPAMPPPATPLPAAPPPASTTPALPAPALPPPSSTTPAPPVRSPRPPTVTPSPEPGPPPPGLVVVWGEPPEQS
jgi:hypothetical protein